MEIEIIKKIKEITINEDEFIKITAMTAADMSKDMKLNGVEDFNFMLLTATLFSKLAANLFERGEEDGRK